MTTDRGQSFTVYRETTVEPPDHEQSESGVVLAFRFRPRFVLTPIAPVAVRVFEPLSILTTPFFAGLHGFRTKLWLSDHETGDYLVVSRWKTPDDAERYARTLETLVAALSIPGSVSYEIDDGASIDEYVAARSADRRGEADASVRRSPYRRIGRIARVGGILGIVFWLVVRPWHVQRGAVEEELERELPGTDIVPEPAVNTVRSVTIDALPEDVWPWLVQISQGRSGFYSYDWLEQLTEIDTHEIDRIIPGYEGPSEGDEIALSPQDLWVRSWRR